MKIISSSLLGPDLEQHLIEAYPEINFIFYENILEAEDDLATADVLITYGEDLNPNHIEKARDLKWIMAISAGLEQIPLEAIQKKGIVITNARGIHKIPMAEYTFGVLLQTVKNMKQWIENEHGHLWKRDIFTDELAGKTMAIIGTGAIGGEIARIAEAFRMKTIGISHSGKPVPHIDEQYTVKNKMEVLSHADVIVSILPSTAETCYFYTKKEFKIMKTTAIFINIGRGNAVKEEDLIQALKEGRPNHAVLDVFEKEPLPPDHPFWAMSQVTVTSHFSSRSNQYLPRSIAIFEENLRAYINGEPLPINRVDPDRGY